MDNQRNFLFGTISVLSVSYLIYIYNKKRGIEMMSSQRGYTTGKHPLLLYKNETWQGDIRPVQKDEIVQIMQQTIDKEGKITRRWFFKSFKTLPHTHLHWSADKNGTIATADTMVGFNNPDLQQFIFSNHKIFGVKGLDLNNKKHSLVNVYVKVM